MRVPVHRGGEHPPGHWYLPRTVSKRAVRTLLECILVDTSHMYMQDFHQNAQDSKIIVEDCPILILVLTTRSLRLNLLPYNE